MGLLNSTEQTLGNAWQAVKNFFAPVPAAAVHAACAGKDVVVGAASAVADGAKSVAKSVGHAAVATKKFFYDRPYKDVDGKRFRVCTCGDKTTIEPVHWDKQKGKFVATGKLPDPPFNADNKTLKDPLPDPEGKYPKTIEKTPDLTHINGIQNNPAQALQSAGELSRQVKKGCPDKNGCGCLIDTYSESMGMGADLAACLGAKAGVDDRVTKIQEDDMRRAIDPNRKDGPHPLIVSAHSRGSLHTDNAWKNVRDEQTQKNLDENPDTYADSPEALQARDEAAATQSEVNAADPAGGSVSPGLAGEVARRNAARRLAEKDANATMNDNVHVVTAGNPVSFPDPGQDATNVYTQTEAGKPADKVNWLGNRKHVKPVVLDDKTMAHAKQVADANPIGDNSVDTGMHHSFDQYYAPTVADEYCKRKAK